MIWIVTVQKVRDGPPLSWTFEEGKNKKPLTIECQEYPQFWTKSPTFFFEAKLLLFLLAGGF